MDGCVTVQNATALFSYSISNPVEWTTEASIYDGARARIEPERP